MADALGERTASSPARLAASPDAVRTLRHELRTPINHITGYAELLLEEAEDRGSDAATDLRRIQQAGGTLAALVDELLGPDRPKAGELETQLTDQRFRSALDTVIGYAELLQEEAAGGAEWMLGDLGRIRDASMLLMDLLGAAMAGSTAWRRGGTAPVPEAAPGEAAEPIDRARATPAEGKILIVDDDPANRDILARRVARLGYEVAEAADGREALAAMRARAPDLVLLDVRMPILSGLDVLREMKSDEALRELPVVVLSAGNETEDAARCIELGADDYLPKPFNPVVLRARVESSLERKRLRDREVAYLRRAAHVTGPAALADVLYRAHGSWQAEPAPPELPEAEAALLRDAEAALSWVRLEKGDVLLRQGDPSDGVYVLIQGRLRVVEESDGEPPRVLGEVRRGETVGEWGMLSGQPRTATVIALRDALLARFSRESFERLTERHPRALTHATEDVIGRMRQTFHARPHGMGVTSIALVPLGPDVPLDELAGALAAELGARDPTLHLGRARLEGLVGAELARLIAEGADEGRALGWLNDQELAHRFVLYQADPEPSAWTLRCLRQADRVLFVARAGASPEPAALERMLPDLGAWAASARWELVLLHEARPSVASGTGEWLARRNVAAHHHVARGSAADLKRLARRLSGRGVGLVLGGGGLRGAAHIGVIKALEEGGVPIDFVGGTSAGACVAGLYALGHRPDEIFGAIRDMVVRDKIFADYTVPVVALLAGRRIGDSFRRIVGDARIEDLWLPYFCVASNLTRAEPLVYRQGPLWRALRASSSIPGVLPPLLEDGDLVVDGALLNNLPADVMAELCEGGPVVASDVRVKVDMADDYRIEDAVSGARLLWRRLVPFRKERPRAPGIASVLLRASQLGSVHAGAAHAKPATFYVNPPVGDFPMLDARNGEAMFALGYEATREKIEEWRRAGPLPGA